MKQYSENFSDKDFPSGTPNIEFMVKLQMARDHYGKPMIISSAGRHPDHNLAVGGVFDSAHLIDADGFFRAVDIVCTTSAERFGIVTALLEVGFTRIGYYQKHLHVDDDPTKPQNVMWWGKS